MAVEHGMNDGIERHGRGARYERWNKNMAVEHGMKDGIKTWPYEGRNKDMAL